ncbi:hypothetical protein [Virgibacillus ndiopensis]|uniref:hypothetical protein n=1 Tax=Virgibacillus ndiopensis TaxID=2004408 RepID=UPI000C06F66A|nr:hypothetical protein [Virgibacillus ndiopensis]
MKKILLIVALILLAACSDKEATNDKSEDTETEAVKNETTEKEDKSEDKQKDDQVLTKIGESTTDQTGIVTLEKIKTIDENIKEDPIKVEFLDVKVLSRDDMTQEFTQYVSQFSPISGKDGLKTIQVRYNLKNTSGHDIYWNGLTHVITDQNEQFNVTEVDFVRNVNVYEPIFADVELEYVQSFVIKNPDITDVRFVFDKGVDYDTSDEVFGEFEYKLSFE